MSSHIVNQRINFESVKKPMPYPDFLDVQLKSFRDFLQLDTPPENVRTTDFTRFLQKISPSQTRAITSFLNFLITTSTHHAIPFKNAWNAGLHTAYL